MNCRLRLTDAVVPWATASDPGRGLEVHVQGSAFLGDDYLAEADLARRFSDLKVRRELKQKEILEQEAGLYYDTYKKIVDEVTRFADSNGVTLVLRYESKPIDRDNRNEVIQGVNRRVVFQRNRDLTNFIVAEMNKNVR